MAAYIKVGSINNANVPQYWQRQIVSASQSNVYYNDGYVGLGHPAPTERLQVVGNAKVDGNLVVSGTITGPSANQWVTGAASAISYSAGSVGINTSTPTEKLEVAGNTRISGNLIVGGTVTSTGTTFSQWTNVAGGISYPNNVAIAGSLSVTGTTTTNNTVVNNTETVSSSVTINNAGTGPGLKVTQTGTQPVAQFFDDSTMALCIADGGNVGVRTTAPSVPLEVNGSARATRLFANTAEDTNYVLKTSGNHYIGGYTQIAGTVDVYANLNVGGYSSATKNIVQIETNIQQAASTISTTSTAYVYTSVNQGSITPQSASNKIMVDFFSGMAGGDNSAGLVFTLERSTNAGGSWTVLTGGTYGWGYIRYNYQTLSVMFIDAPGVNSTVLYRVGYKQASGTGIATVVYGGSYYGWKLTELKA